MREEQTKKIGDHSYSVREMSPLPAQRLFVRLSKVVGPAIAEITGNGKEGLKSAAVHVFANISEAEVEDITKQMAKLSEVDGKPLHLVFETHFTGKHSDLWQWLFFALEVQFKDFFDVLRGLFNEAAPAGQASPSPTTFGGQSGG